MYGQCTHLLHDSSQTVGAIVSQGQIRNVARFLCDSWVSCLHSENIIYCSIYMHFLYNVELQPSDSLQLLQSVGLCGGRDLQLV